MSKIIYVMESEPFIGSNNMYNYLYKIVNEQTQEYYIGVHSTQNLDDGYSGSGKFIKIAIKEYGIEAFSKHILQFFDDIDAMYKKEELIVNEDFLQNPLVYNCACGGEHCRRVNFTLSKSHKQKISNTLTGHTVSAETREKISKSLVGKYTGTNSPNYGRKITPEELAKRKELAKARNYYGDSNPFYGKRHSKEVCEILSNSKRNRKRIHNPETKEMKMVHQEELDLYLQAGWLLGSPKRVRLYHTEQKEILYVYPEEVERYLNTGWIEQPRQRYVTIFHPSTKERIRIKIQDFDEYISRRMDL